MTQVTAGGTTSAIVCPGTGGPAMVLLPEGYCVDRTEVTRAQYEAWLSTKPSTDGQPSNCTWNTSFAPNTACMKWDTVCQTGCSEHPQVCVDWCDAFAYCASMAKRLCGAIGAGANPFDAYEDATRSQWFNACTSGDAGTESSFGSDYVAQTCNGSDASIDTTVVVGSFGGCQSSVTGYRGVFDLSGNVEEWEDSCDGATGASDYCHLRGGSYDNINLGIRCAGSYRNKRNTTNSTYGFRCCAL